MAIQTWVGISILHGPLEVACNAKAFNAPTVTVAELDQTALCHSWRVVKGGLKSFSWSASVMQDFADAGYDQTTWAQLATADVSCSMLPAGADAGDLAYLFPTLALAYDPNMATVGDTTMASLSGGGSGPVARGLLMHDTATARTSSGSGTAYQLGAVSATQRIYGALHVTAASGATPSLTVKLQSSATEGGSYTDRVTFTAATDVTSEWSSAAGAITDTWWKAAWTVSGTSPSFTFGLSAGITTP